MQKRDLDPAQSIGLPLGDWGSSPALCIHVCPPLCWQTWEGFSFSELVLNRDRKENTVCLTERWGDECETAQRATLKGMETKFEGLVYTLLIRTWAWFPWRRVLRHRNAFVSHSSPFVWGGRDVVAQLRGYWPTHLTIKIESTLCRPLLFYSRVRLA